MLRRLGKIGISVIAAGLLATTVFGAVTAQAGQDNLLRLPRPGDGILGRWASRYHADTAGRRRDRA